MAFHTTTAHFAALQRRTLLPFPVDDGLGGYGPHDVLERAASKVFSSASEETSPLTRRRTPSHHSVTVWGKSNGNERARASGRVSY